MKIQSYRELDVWQLAMELADEVYDCTTRFPKDEFYGLASQIKRAAISVPSNIAEGSARSGTRDLLRFIDIAEGSLAELETQLIFANRRNYISPELLSELLSKSTSINRMLSRLYQSLEKKVA